MRFVERGFRAANSSVNRMWIEAALNGTRTKAENPAVPITPQELALEATAAVGAGAQALHVHPRNLTGLEDLTDQCVADTLDRIREACPTTPLGVTTGLWVFSDPEARVAAIASWSTLPDFASVNFSEPGAVELARLLLLRGIAVEAGLSSPADAETFLSSPFAGRCNRVLLEPDEQEVAGALGTLARIEALLDDAGSITPRLLHGFDATAWPLFYTAEARGYCGRMGFEDVLSLPDGELASSNAVLLAFACQETQLRRDA